VQKYPARHRAIIAAIRGARLEKGISQRALSAQLKEVVNYIYMIEAGRRNVLAEELFAIADALDMDVHELVDRVLSRRRRG
jgi:transcriptional regulator with XRE-family HTH domain